LVLILDFCLFCWPKRRKKTEKKSIAIAVEQLYAPFSIKITLCHFQSYFYCYKSNCFFGFFGFDCFQFFVLLFLFFPLATTWIASYALFSFFSSWQWTLEQVGFGAMGAKGVIRIYMSIFRGMSQKSRMSRIKWNTNRT